MSKDSVVVKTCEILSLYLYKGHLTKIYSIHNKMNKTWF